MYIYITYMYKNVYIYLCMGEEMNLMLYTITPWVASNKMTHRAILHVDCGACRISYERRNVNFMRGCGV